MSPARVTCPTCQRGIEWTDAFPARPFCSERCRLIDLGAWLAEQRAVPGEPLDGESAQLDLAAPGDAAHPAAGDIGHDDP